MVAEPQAGPALAVKDHVGLPPGKIPVVLADVAVSVKAAFQKFGLEMVDLLKPDQIGGMALQKSCHKVPALLPPVIPVPGQAEPQVHGHYAE